MMKQIILITDGCSNVGVDPVVAAAHAFEEHIVVNVIGVVDQGSIGESGADEIAEIAKSGGGMSRIVTSGQLAQTVQMMTRKTVSHTIHQVVNKELQQILGSESIEQLSPYKRAQVVQVIDDLGETTSLRVALLIDTSASMRPKLPAVEEAIKDLMLSLQSRKGNSEISVFHFPGSGRYSGEAEIDLDWTKELMKVNSLFRTLNMKGATPTGPALLKVVQFYTQGASRNMGQESRRTSGLESDGLTVHGKEGICGDYVV